MRSIMPLFALALAVSGPALATELVPVQPFRSIELRGGGNVALVHGSAQRVTVIEGSTEFTRFRTERDGKLVIDACNARCPQTYRLRIQIESPHVPDVAVTGGGAIRAEGGFAPQDRLSAAIMGGGEVDVRAVDASNVSAAVHGGGEIAVRPSVTLSAAVNGGGAIHYWGNPQVTTAIMGGGTVQRGK